MKRVLIAGLTGRSGSAYCDGGRIREKEKETV